MDDELEIRRAIPEDTPEIVELMKLSLGEGQVPRSEAYWTWKHRVSPFGVSPCLLAVADGRIVGLRVFMRWQWDAAGNTFDSVRAVDTATHPKWRGRGVFTKLTRALLEEMKAEDVRFVFNTPNRKSLPGYLKMGWRKIGRVSPWIRPLRLRVFSEREGSEAGRPVSELLAQTDQLTTFLSALESPSGRFRTPRSVAYLQWRYAIIPDIPYRATWDFDEGEGAVLIFRRKHDGRWPELRVCECLVGRNTGSRRRARRLLRTLARCSDASFVTGMAPPGSSAGRTLLGSAFIPGPRLGPLMTVRPLAEGVGAPDPSKRTAWDLSIGDLELF